MADNTHIIYNDFKRNETSKYSRREYLTLNVDGDPRFPISAYYSI